jgi:hypothetical protein
MTTYNIFTNANLQLGTVTNNDALTRVLVVDGSNNVLYRNVSSINPFNQNLNTTNSPTFVTLTATSITGPTNSGGSGNVIQLFTNNFEYQMTTTTTNATTAPLNILTTVNNTNYTITAEVSAFCRAGTAVGSGGSFRQMKRATNNAGTITLSANMENLTNVTAALSGITILITNTGNVLQLNVTGLASQTIAWVAWVGLNVVS